MDQLLEPLPLPISPTSSFHPPHPLLPSSSCSEFDGPLERAPKADDDETE